MRFLLTCTASTLISVACFCQSHTTSPFRETKADTLAKKMENVLILGIGSTASQLFLDNLTNKLISKFEFEKVTADYRYLGKDVNEALKDTNLNQVKNFTTVLVFLPKGSSFFEITTRFSHDLTPAPNAATLASGKIAYTKVSYAQEFDVRLYAVENEKKLIWSAILEVDDLMSKKMYSAIAKSFVNRFKKHQYIE